MYKYILKRILLLIPVIIGVIVLIFTILWFAPSDAAEIMAGETATEQQIQALREELGLNQPYIVQLAKYIWNIARLDFGNGLTTGASVKYEISTRLGNSLRFAITGIAMSIIIGIPLGVFAALHRGKAGDYIATILSLIGSVMPSFWFALMLVLLFSYRLGWFPAHGIGGVRYWVLPLTAVSVGGIANMCRQTRSGLLDVLNSDFVLMAKAKGLSRKKVIWRHAVPNALLPLITMAGLNFGSLLGGGLVLEKVFSIPGMGTYLTTSVNQRDTTAVIGGIVVISVFFSLMMLLTDVILAYVDPRIKAQYAGTNKVKVRGKEKA